ncbi:hypothetical protein B484DRAFT_390446, partial [Ochromonadaceae sp. CCMP2298]
VSREFLLTGTAVSKLQRGKSAAESLQLLSAGHHLRVHFDSCSHSWDEWYSQEDLDLGLVLPVYTHCTRKLRMHEVPLVQRRLVYTTGNPLHPSATLHIEVLDTPGFVQCESYRTLAHCHQQVCEQMYRYLDEGERDRNNR